LCCFLTSNAKGKHIFRYRLSPETFGYTLVVSPHVHRQLFAGEPLNVSENIFVHARPRSMLADRHTWKPVPLTHSTRAPKKRNLFSGIKLWLLGRGMSEPAHLEPTCLFLSLSLSCTWKLQGLLGKLALSRRQCFYIRT